MRRVLISVHVSVFLLSIICGSSAVHAQKAYETISFSSIIDGAKVNFKFADGYFAASWIRLQKGGRSENYRPENGEPLVSGDRKFLPARKGARFQYIVVSVPKTDPESTPDSVLLTAIGTGKKIKVIAHRSR